MDVFTDVLNALELKGGFLRAESLFLSGAMNLRPVEIWSFTCSIFMETISVLKKT